jgi:uncharacterized membrane protein YeaQ/YmgE (transglycosylase-associated protein family)
MNFIIGFLIWLAFGVVAGAAGQAILRGPGTAMILTSFFGIMGAFVGGMLGMSPYIFHTPEPLRVGGIIGALAGALFFVVLYHFTARKVA